MASGLARWRPTNRFFNNAVDSFNTNSSFRSRWLSLPWRTKKCVLTFEQWRTEVSGPRPTPRQREHRRGAVATAAAAAVQSFRRRRRLDERVVFALIDKREIATKHSFLASRRIASSSFTSLIRPMIHANFPRQELSIIGSQSRSGIQELSFSFYTAAATTTPSAEERAEIGRKLSQEMLRTQQLVPSIRCRFG